MRSISENDLSTIIPLLAEKISALKLELAHGDGREDDMTDAEFDAHTDTSDLLDSYVRTMDNLVEEYESALTEGLILPSIEALTKRFFQPTN